MSHAEIGLEVVYKDLYKAGTAPDLSEADPVAEQDPGEQAPTAEEIAAEILRQQEEREAAEAEEEEPTNEEVARQEELAEMQIQATYVLAETLPAIEYCLIFIICLMVGGFIHKVIYRWIDRNTM